VSNTYWRYSEQADGRAKNGIDRVFDIDLLVHCRGSVDQLCSQAHEPIASVLGFNFGNGGLGQASDVSI
jgi:hypothetical protein